MQAVRKAVRDGVRFEGGVPQDFEICHGDQERDGRQGARGVNESGAADMSVLWARELGEASHSGEEEGDQLAVLAVRSVAGVLHA